jgi:ATP-dependent RNA helicase DDX6/DHH1
MCVVVVFYNTVLILVPTRELALQTSSVVRELGKHMGIECMVSTGGTSLKDDIMRLYSTVHILVGTPGRILDLANKQVANLNNCKIVVMDEADKLLSAEFQPLLEQLLNCTAPNRQICLFSATFPQQLRDFKEKFIPNPYEINLMDDLTLKGITQYYAFVKERQKVHCLNTLFSKVKHIIFCQVYMHTSISSPFCFISCTFSNTNLFTTTTTNCVYFSWISTNRLFSATL